MQIKKIGVWTILTIIISSYLLVTQLLYEDKYLGMKTPPRQLHVKISHPLNLWLVKYYQSQNKTAILLPIGRPSSLESDVKFSLNKDMINPQIITGPCGGYWVNLTFDTITSDSVFSIYRTLPSATYYHEEIINHSKWIESSPFIDSDEEIIRQEATNLTESTKLVSDKAQVINSFVHDHIIDNKGTVFPENASQIYLSQKGRCRHYARLFVALCRGVGIPARTIGGCLLTDTSPTADYHLWAEFFDESNHWIPVDPTHGYFNFSNTHFLDLSFAKYQHPFNSSEAFFSNASTLIGGYGQVKITAVSFSMQNLLELGFYFSAFLIISAGAAYILIETPILLHKFIEKRRNRKNPNN